MVLAWATRAGIGTGGDGHDHLVLGNHEDVLATKPHRCIDVLRAVTARVGLQNPPEIAVEPIPSPTPRIELAVG